MQTPNNPQDMGLPHDKWRTNQREALEKCISMYNNGGGNIFLQLGTGSGKSVIPTALSKIDRVVVLVQSLGLLEQYEREYGFDIVKGRSSYQCVLSSKIKMWEESYGHKPTASDCHFARKEDCHRAKECPYLIAKQTALSSNKMACTYKYAALSDSVQKRDGIIVFDEVQAASDEILAVTEIKFQNDDIVNYGLPNFPITGYGIGGLGDIADGKVSDLVLAWLLYCNQQIDKQISPLEQMSKKSSAARVLKSKLDTSISLMYNSSNNIFIYSGKKIEPVYSKKNSMFNNLQELIIKPLEPAIITKKIIESKNLVVFMSATIGNPLPLSREIGVDKYSFEDYPHPIPKQYRPVYDLKVPKMTWDELQKNPALYNIQGARIKAFIDTLDPEWRGIILTTSNLRIQKLKEFLYRCYPDRIFDNSGMNVSDRISSFISDTTKGKIIIDTIQGLGHGVNLVGDIARFCVVAGIPYQNPDDRYSKLRLEREHGKEYGFYTAFSSIPQAAGRVSRGEVDESGNYILNVAALADEGMVQPNAQRFYPRYFRDSIS